MPTAKNTRPSLHAPKLTLHKALGWILVIFISIVLLGVLLPASEQGLSKAPMCLYNEKALCLGLLMYVEDNNKLLPSAANWGDAIRGSVKSSDLFNDPGAKNHFLGYAFNSSLGGKKVPTMDAGNRPLVFDSQTIAWNAADPLTSVCNPPRHISKNNFAFADGHVKSLRADMTPKP